MEEYQAYTQAYEKVPITEYTQSVKAERTELSVTLVCGVVIDLIPLVTELRSFCFLCCFLKYN